MLGKKVVQINRIRNLTKLFSFFQESSEIFDILSGFFSPAFRADSEKESTKIHTNLFPILRLFTESFANEIFLNKLQAYLPLTCA